MFSDAWAGVIDCRDPATGELLGEVPDLGEADVLARIHRARSVQPAWEGQPARARTAVVRGVLARVVQTQDELCRIAAHDSGETMLDAMVHEVLPLCRDLHKLSADAKRLPQRARRALWGRAGNARRNVSAGVVGVIAPGDRPLLNLMLPVARALLGGNAAVVKVSNRVAWSSLNFAELLRDVLAEHDHPRDLLQVITGGVDSGEALASGGCDRLEFTGTEETSRAVATAAARTQTPTRLSLDDPSPIVIRREDDVMRALQPAARRVFGGAGQLNGGAPLVYVHRQHLRRFVDAATTLVRRLRCGSPMRLDVDCGPLVDRRRVEVLTQFIRDAQQHGATVYAGGSPDDRLGGSFFQPTLLSPVTSSMQLTRTRLLGPLMAVVPYDHLAELQMPSAAQQRLPSLPELERVLGQLPLYPARPSSFALLESLVRARYGSGLRLRGRAFVAASRHALADLRGRFDRSDPLADITDDTNDVP